MSSQNEFTKPLKDIDERKPSSPIQSVLIGTAIFLVSMLQAKRTGLAIGMGNAFLNTIYLVSQFARQAKQNGIEITPVYGILRAPRS